MPTSRSILFTMTCLLLSTPSIALACACGCGVFDVGTGTMLPTGTGGEVWFEYDFMNQTPQGAKGQQSEGDREALFKQFQAWQADQAAKENARAQAPAPAVRARAQKEQ